MPLQRLPRYSDEELGKYERASGAERELEKREGGRADQLRRELSTKRRQHAYARMKRAISKLLAANTKQVLKLLGAETTSALLPLA